MAYYHTYEKWEILCLETAEEYLAKKKIKLEEVRIKHEKYKKEVEAKGECECGYKEYLRWIDDEFYVCYECFCCGLKFEAEQSLISKDCSYLDKEMSEEIWDEMSDEEYSLI